MQIEPRQLSRLGLRAADGRDPVVTGISVDSRQVRDGHLFAALPGSATHGGEFIQFALRQGAGAILTDRQGAEIAAGVLAGSDAALVVAEDPRAALIKMTFSDGPHAGQLVFTTATVVALLVTRTGVADRAQIKRIQAKVGATADGRIGPRTAAAIAQWQRKNKLTADSKVGPATWAAMSL